MTAPLPVFINGRFLTAAPSAVHRVAKELTLALLRLQTEDKALSNRYTFRLVVPPDACGTARSLGVPFEVVGKHSGILWEQFDLPRLCRGGRIVGFFNTVPIFGKGHITLLHDAHVFEIPKSYPLLKCLWRRLLSHRAAAQGRLILTVSDHAKSRLLAHRVGQDDQIHVVPNGVGHLATLSPNPTIHTRLGINRPYFVALSSLLPHKNIPLLLQCFARPEMQQVRLILVGKTTKTDYLCAGHTVPDNVHFAGFVRDAELSALFRDAVAVLTPSRTEGFGLPPAEALMLGTPAIVAPTGALPEVCGNGVLYADPDNAQDWAICAQQLLTDRPLRAALVTAGRAHVAQFTWDNAARALITALDHHSTAPFPAPIAAKSF